MKPTNAAAALGRLSQQKHPRDKEYMRALAKKRWSAIKEKKMEGNA